MGLKDIARCRFSPEIKKLSSLFIYFFVVVDLQCCVSFCCTAKWFSYIYIYTHTYIFFFILFSIMFYYKVLNIVQFPRSRRSPGGGNGNPPSILDWRIPWTEEAGGVQSMGSQRVGHYWSDLACTHVLHRRTLFFICFVYTSLYLLIPNSEKIKLFKCDNYQQLKQNY